MNEILAPLLCCVVVAILVRVYWRVIVNLVLIAGIALMLASFLFVFLVLENMIHYT
jgi:hypothetical protein